MNDFKPNKFGRGGGFQKKGFNKFDNRRFDGGGFDKPTYSATCAACGRRAEVPFKPQPGRDIYCKDCFHRDERPEFGQHERPDFKRREDRFERPKTFGAPAKTPDFSRDLQELNRKLDEILKALQALKPQLPGAEAQAAATPPDKKPATETKPKKPAKKETAAKPKKAVKKSK